MKRTYIDFNQDSTFGGSATTPHTQTKPYEPIVASQDSNALTALPTSPLDSHFPSYRQLHPLSLTEKQSVYATCVKNFDILDNVREDIVVLNEKTSSKIKDSFFKFGVWPRSRHAALRHLEIQSGWILLEFDSASNQNIEYYSEFEKQGPELAFHKVKQQNVNIIGKENQAKDIEFNMRLSQEEVPSSPPRLDHSSESIDSNIDAIVAEMGERGRETEDESDRKTQDADSSAVESVLTIKDHEQTHESVNVTEAASASSLLQTQVDSSDVSSVGDEDFSIQHNMIFHPQNHRHAESRLSHEWNSLSDPPSSPMNVLPNKASQEGGHANSLGNPLSSERPIDMPTAVMETAHDDPYSNQPHVYALAFEKSLFFWVYFPSAGQWKWSLHFRHNSSEKFVPCFKYHITVRRPWTYQFGAFAPTLFETTCMHCDERIQVLTPLQYYLQENTVARFELWLNKRLFSHVGVLLRRKNNRKRIFFLQPKGKSPSQREREPRFTKDANAAKGKKSVRHGDIHMELYSGDILLHFPEGSSDDLATATLLLFQNDNLSLENAIVITQYLIKPRIEFTQMDLREITSSDFIDIAQASLVWNEPSVQKYDPLGRAPSLSPKKNTTKVSVYENISRFWTHDIHLFLPKTRYLRAGAHTKFKLRLSNTHSVYARNGNMTYTIQKSISHFQGTYGEEATRMELFESTIIFKEPRKTKKGDAVYLYYIPNGSDMTQGILIAEFVLLPSLKNESKEEKQPLAWKESLHNTQSTVPKPIGASTSKEEPEEVDLKVEHRPLFGAATLVPRTESPRRKLLPNLSLEAAFLNRPQMIYSVEFTKVPKKIPSEVKKRLPFLHKDPQININDYNRAKMKRKHQVQEELDEYWKVLKKAQRQPLSEDTAVVGRETSGREIISYEETKNELANILLKSAQVDEIARKNPKTSRTLTRLPKELTMLLARRDNMISTIRNYHTSTPINSSSNPVLHMNRVFSSSSAGHMHSTAPGSIAAFKEQEDSLYGLKPRSKSPGKNPRGASVMHQRAALLSPSYREEEGKSAIDDVMERMGRLLPHEDIRKLVSDLPEEYDSEDEVVALTSFDPAKAFRLKEENLRRSRMQRRKPARRQEVEIVYQKSLSPRKNEDSARRHSPSSRENSKQDEMIDASYASAYIDWSDDYSPRETHANAEEISGREDFSSPDLWSGRNHVSTPVGRESPSRVDAASSISMRTYTRNNGSPGKGITSPSRNLSSPIRNLSSPNRNLSSPTRGISSPLKTEDEISKAEQGKLMKMRLKEEKKRMKEKRELELQEKNERAKELRAQRRDQELELKELEERMKQERQEKIAKEKEDSLQKIQHSVRMLKDAKMQESDRLRQEHKAVLETKRRNHAKHVAEKKAKVEKGKISSKSFRVSLRFGAKTFVLENLLRPISTLDLQHVLRLRGDQLLFLHIKGLRDVQSGEEFPFARSSTSPAWIELQNQHRLDPSTHYEVVSEDLATTLKEIPSTIETELEGIFKRIYGYRDDGQAIPFDKFMMWLETYERRPLDELMESLDTLIFAKPNLSHDINNYRSQVKRLASQVLQQLSDTYAQESIRRQTERLLTHTSQPQYISLDTFVLIEGRRRYAQQLYDQHNQQV